MRKNPAPKNQPTDPVSSETAANELDARFKLENLVDKQVLLQELHVSDRTLYNWRKQGLLAFIKLMGKIYYSRLDLRDFFQNNWHKGKAYKSER
jgi:hypothetical protein